MWSFSDIQSHVLHVCSGSKLVESLLVRHSPVSHWASHQPAQLYCICRGEDGYFRIKRGKDECGIEDGVIFSSPTAKCSRGTEPRPGPEPKDCLELTKKNACLSPKQYVRFMRMVQLWIKYWWMLWQRWQGAWSQVLVKVIFNLRTKLSLSTWGLVVPHSLRINHSYVSYFERRIESI